MATIASGPSVPVSVTPELRNTWIKDPLRPERNVSLGCVASLALTRSREQAVHEGLDRPDPIVQTGVRRSRRGTLAVTPLTYPDQQAVEVLLDSATTLLLHQPSEAVGWPGVALYFIVTGDDVSTPIGEVRAPQRVTSFGVTEVRRPV